ncbi:MAG: hypothetical protein ACR2J8_14795, partial [Thermomicrobiales bacterium]
LEGRGYAGDGSRLPDKALSWDVILHSAKGERARERAMIGTGLEINPAKMPNSRRAFKDAWLEIALTVTDRTGRSRTSSIAYGMALPDAGIPERKNGGGGRDGTPVPTR